MATTVELVATVARWQDGAVEVLLDDGTRRVLPLASGFSGRKLRPGQRVVLVADPDETDAPGVVVGARLARAPLVVHHQ